ncbi:hypothetical protein M8J76_007904 [Diaphorina citri]|nr:hypothetical protein M8J75_011457 [Diaphorina citri]KAI5722410.1 hypothetical protein M8J76_007904 [Diaphorina citri]
MSIKFRFIGIGLTILLLAENFPLVSLHEDNGVYGRQANPERESEVRGYGTRYRQSSYSSSYGYNRNSRESREYGRTETSGSRETYGRPDPSSGLCKPRINKFKAQPEADQNIADQCFASQAPQCNRRTKYRTLDGTCNNLRRPWWGAVDTAHVRLMRPYYEDGVSSYRVSQVDASPLPNARVLSRVFLPDRNISDVHTRMYLEFSQLVAHDITLNPQESTGPKCCSDSGDRVRSTSGNCRPILIPSNDDFYSQFNRRCLEYKRSLAINCSVGALQPIVQSTHFIDVSFMYGSHPDKARELRSLSRGKLRVREVNGRTFMPTGDPSNCVNASSNICYDAGDIRVNQQLDLAVSQTVWLRFHNYVAEKLIQQNPSWSNRDELVYQEARRLVIGCFQHIVYNEWLPILIGESYTKDVGLSPTSSGYFQGYDPEVNPSTLADFAAGAFRGLHSLIPGTIKLVNERRVTNQELPFSSTMQHPGDILEVMDVFDSTLRGLTNQLQQYQDRFITEQMTNFLIDAAVPTRGLRGEFGDDLAARDIQRGRDYGLRPYVDYRELCGLSTVRSFGDLNDFMDSEQVTRLSQVYRGVNDIDYYIGGLLESVIRGTLSSPSFRCVFAEAFYRYKYGDRYFYEGPPATNPGAFTPAQLDAIKKVFLSQIICIGSDRIVKMQLQSFYMPSESNPILSCDKLKEKFDVIFSYF